MPIHPQNLDHGGNNVQAQPFHPASQVPA